MFSSLTLHGAGGSLLWGYRAVVEFAAWRIAKDAKTERWVLTGTATRIDAFGVRQGPLLFTAPREGGVWAWGIESIQVGGGGAILAQLGPPER